MEKVKLGDIFEYMPKSKIKAGEGKKQGKYKFFTSSNLQDKYIDKWVYNGEYLIFGTGGKASINYCNEKFSTSTDNFVVKVKKEINAKLIYLYFKNDMQKLEKGFKGASIKHISKDYINQLTIPIYDFKFQEKIVKQLDKVQEIIDLRKKQIEELDELIKSKLAEMFDWHKYKEKKLAEVSNFIDYRGHTPQVSRNGGIRMINAKSVGKGFFKYIDEFVTEELYNEWMHRGFAYSGDVLFVTEGHTFGNTCLIPNDLTRFALGQRVITIQGNKDLNNTYLCYYMQLDEFKNKINMYKTGGTAQGIRSKDLLKITIPIPPIELQNQFAEFVKQNDKQKYILEKSLKETEDLQKSLMNKYFI